MKNAGKMNSTHSVEMHAPRAMSPHSWLMSPMRAAKDTPIVAAKNYRPLVTTAGNVMRNAISTASRFSKPLARSRLYRVVISIA